MPYIINSCLDYTTISIIIKMKGTIIFSPHPDDVAFSIGGALSRKYFEEPITIVTLFGKTNFLGLKGIQASPSKATLIRELEDKKFANIINAKLIYFKYPDALLRNKNNAKLVFSTPIKIKSSIYKRLTNQINKIIIKCNPSFIGFPLGLGRHSDHILLNNILLEVSMKMKNKKIKTFMYEDLPYAYNFTYYAIKQRIKTIAKSPYSINITLESNINSKKKLIKIYSTQLHDNKMNKIITYAHRINKKKGAEKIWFYEGVSLNNEIEFC